MAKLSATMGQILADPATKRFSEQQGLPLPLDDKQLAQSHRREIEKYRKIAWNARIEVE